MSVHSFSPWCYSQSWVSNDFVWPFALRLLMTSPNARLMTCAMQCIWLLNIGYSIPEASMADWSSQVIKSFEEALSVAIPSKWTSLQSKLSRTSSTCIATRATGCWPLTYHPELALKIRNEQAFNIIKSKLHISQCPIVINKVCSDRCYSHFARRYPPVWNQANCKSWWQFYLNCIHHQ